MVMMDLHLIHFMRLFLKLIGASFIGKLTNLALDRLPNYKIILNQFETPLTSFRDGQQYPLQMQELPIAPHMIHIISSKPVMSNQTLITNLCI